MLWVLAATEMAFATGASWVLQDCISPLAGLGVLATHGCVAGYAATGRPRLLLLGGIGILGAPAGFALTHSPNEVTGLAMMAMSVAIAPAAALAYISASLRVRTLPSSMGTFCLLVASFALPWLLFVL